MEKCTPTDRPLLFAMLNKTPQQKWLDPTSQEVFAAMPSLHGETFGFVIDDVLEMRADEPVIVDDFRTLPREVAPLLAWREQVLFLIPTEGSRRSTLGVRSTDPIEARFRLTQA